MTTSFYDLSVPTFLVVTCLGLSGASSTVPPLIARRPALIPATS